MDAQNVETGRPRVPHLYNVYLFLRVRRKTEPFLCYRLRSNLTRFKGVTLLEGLTRNGPYGE